MARSPALAALWLLVAFVPCIVCMIEEITNAEHLDDSMFYNDGKQRRRSPVLFALYTPKCQEQMYNMFSEVGLPQDHALFKARFDYVSREQQAWYKWSEDFDLLPRFQQYRTGCLDIFFLPKHNNSEVIVWNQRGSLADWVWSQMKIVATVTNAHDSTARIFYVPVGHTQRSPDPIAVLQPGESTRLNTHVSHRFVAVDDADRLITGFDVSYDTTQFELRREANAPHAVSEWITNKQKQVDKELDVLRAMWWSHARRHLLGIKQPPMMPGFTKTGFLKAKMPKRAFKLLTDWYNSNQHLRSVEGWPTGATQINFEHVKTKMLHLPESLKRDIAAIIQKELEEWSGQKLQYSTMYGIREYFRGSILKNHVDRVETHIISCILNVYQETEEPWLVEVLSFQGEKVRIPMEAGDMVLYESSKLLHGRPAPLNGTLYANAFLHFRPVSWDGKFSFTPDNTIVVGDQRVPLRPEHILGRTWKPGDMGYHPASGSYTGVKDEL